MRELRDGIEAEHAARAFDRMGRAKDLVQKIQIFRMLFQLQQPFFDNREMLSGFLEKRILKLREVVVHLKARRS
jgi:hypothetical protein